MTNRFSASGREKGAENVRRLRAWLESVDTIPSKGGKVAVVEIARATGIDRQAFYRNPVIQNLLTEAAITKGLRPIEERTAADTGDGVRRALEQRINRLEQANAALIVENQGLRAKLKRYEALEAQLVQTGRVPR